MITRIILFFLSLAVVSCHPVQVMEKMKSAEIIDGIKVGEDAFFKQNYDEAETIFSHIYNSTTNSMVKNLAIYNLACTRLITSKSKKETRKAMIMLNKWKPSAENQEHLENPLILFQSLQNIFDLKEKDILIGHDMNKKKNIVINKQDIVMKKQGISIEEKDIIIKEKDIVINKKHVEIEQLQELIEKLKHQIVELENIDQEIQEKRSTK